MMVVKLPNKIKSPETRNHDSSITTSITKPIESTTDPPLPTPIINSDEDLWNQLHTEALTAIQDEPLIAPFLRATILSTSVHNFATAIAQVVSFRLYLNCGLNGITNTSPPNDATNGSAESSPPSPSHSCASATSTTPLGNIAHIIQDAMESEDLEYGYSMAEATRLDILACKRRDAACETFLEVVCFYKGFAALVCHRAARRAWGKTVAGAADSPGGANRSPGKGKVTRFVSLWLQSQCSAAFGVDIHPGAEIGGGVFFDHGTGIVIGETAKVGHGCTIMHDVTLGGTGKETGDRHPKVGNDAMIGAGTKILGNIVLGHRCKVGAGSLVLIPIPHGATAVGVPAKIIGHAREKSPGSLLDGALLEISLLRKNISELSLEIEKRDESDGSMQTLPTVSDTDEDSTYIEF